MKKLLYILLFTALPAFASARVYVGTFQVGESLKLENTRVEVTQSSNSGLVTLTLHNVKFSFWMPVRVNVVIQDVTSQQGTLSLEKGIPLMDGKPYSKKRVSNLTGKYAPHSLTLRMTLGKSDVRFSGLLKK